jgi:hypothetical protein
VSVLYHLLLSQKKQNPRLVTILLKTDSGLGGRLRSRSPLHCLRKRKTTTLFKLLDAVTVTKGSTFAQAGKKSLLSVFLPKNSQEPKNQSTNPINHEVTNTISVLRNLT